VNFEEYLKSKKIDAPAFEKAEPMLYSSWKAEFSQMHPNSFTVQKLNLINPVRRKYQLKVSSPQPSANPASEGTAANPTPAKPPVAKPMIKPKPKIN
jgi:hypothetical protein